MKIELTFNGHSMIARLHDNPTARELYAMLPLELSIVSYGNNERSPIRESSSRRRTLMISRLARVFSTLSGLIEDMPTKEPLCAGGT